MTAKTIAPDGRETTPEQLLHDYCAGMMDEDIDRADMAYRELIHRLRIVPAADPDPETVGPMSAVEAKGRIMDALGYRRGLGVDGYVNNLEANAAAVIAALQQREGGNG